MNLSQLVAAEGLNAITANLNGGSMTIYSGTQPASPETALSGNTALVAATFSGAAFNAPAFSNSKMTSSGSFTSGSYAPTASGTATFARCATSGGVAVADLTVGTSGTDVIIGNTAIQTGTNVSFSMTMSVPAA